MFTQKYYAEDDLFQTRKAAIPQKTILLQLLAASLGAILTFHLQLLHQTAIASSAITTCLAWLLLLRSDKNNRALILAVYCGSFAGMSAFCLGADCTDSMASIYGKAALFSLAAALCYVTIQFLSTHFPKAMLAGYGGRLGATAFLSSYLCSLVLSERTDIIDLQQILTSSGPANYIAYSIIACGGSDGTLSVTTKEMARHRRLFPYRPDSIPEPDWQLSLFNFLSGARFGSRSILCWFVHQYDEIRFMFPTGDSRLPVRSRECLC